MGSNKSLIEDSWCFIVCYNVSGFIPFGDNTNGDRTDGDTTNGARTEVLGCLGLSGAVLYRFWAVLGRS